MKRLIPESVLKGIPELYSTENNNDPFVYVILQNTITKWIWMITEYCPDKRLAFGVVRGYEVEAGYISLDEIESAEGMVYVNDFEPKPMSKVQKELGIC